MVILMPVRQRKTCPKCGSYRIDRKRKYKGLYYCIDCDLIFQSPVLRECRSMKVVPVRLKPILEKMKENEADDNKRKNEGRWKEEENKRRTKVKSEINTM
jgi:ribosomal protein L37AE/L43A